jgi:opacity protein-like surface antigen
MEHVMKRLLATAALVALIASPAVAAQSGKRHHPINPSATSAKAQVTKPALNAYNASPASRNYQHGTWDPYGMRFDSSDTD